MGSPWPCAAASSVHAADTSGLHNFHHNSFPSSVITQHSSRHHNHHNQDSHPFFGVAFVSSVDQDSGFFDHYNNPEDLNGVSSNSSPLGERANLQKTRRPPLILPSTQQGFANTTNIVSNNNNNHNYSNYFNPQNHTKRFSSSTYLTTSNSSLVLSPPHGQDEPAKKRFKFRGNGCVLSLREIPTWNIYYHDQRRHLVKFSDNNKICSRDPILNNILNKRVSLSFYKNVLVKLQVDAVVCSTTESYSRDSGVAKLLHEEAGKDLGEVCNQLPKCGVGNVVVTDGFQLPAKFIFHVNGPDIHTLSYEDALRQSYENCLNILVQRELRTIAIPCISTGSRKGIPKNIAAGIALSTVRRFLEQHEEKVDRVVFCLHSKKDIDIYLRLMQIYFPVD